MPLLVSVFRANANGDLAPREVLSYESIALNSQTAALPAEARGLFAQCFNSETVPVRIAWGTTPDAAAATATSATTAGLVVGAGQAVRIPLQGGERISAKAL